MAKNTTKTSVKPAPVASKAPESDGYDIPAVRAAFTEAQGRDIMLSDNVISEIIDRTKTWDEMSFEQQCDLFIKAEETAKAVSIIDPGITVLVSKMDPAFHAAVGKALQAKRDDKASAVFMYANLKRTYTLAELNGMAMPGTECVVPAGTKEKTAVQAHIETTGYRPDKVKTTNAQGEAITKVWLNDLCYAMPEGKAAKDQADTVDKEINNPGTTSYKNHDKEGLKDILASARADWTGLVNVMRRAIKLHHRLAAVNKLNQIGIRFIEGSKEKGIAMPVAFGKGLGEVDKGFTFVTSGPKPLWIYNNSESSKGREFSVTQVLNMQPELARLGPNGGNMGDLLATAGKGPDEPEPGADTEGDGSKMAPDVAQSTLSQFYNWANMRDNTALVRLKIAAHAKDPDGKDWMQLVGMVYHWAKPIYEANQTAYEALIANPNVDQKTAVNQ